ncbi:MAG TPA: FtsX-like permease family protein [Gemmatimonadaceae bacterium]|nr:FtsX-like permease family protein [Gemmatimonadaceae bacterium]
MSVPALGARFPWRRLPALAWKESRTARKRLLLYMSSIALGVAALVAIDSFADNLTTSVREQSRSLLGGDASLTTRAEMTPAADSLVDSLGRTGMTIARVTEFPSMAAITRTGNTRLIQVRGVSNTYPLYGTVITEPATAFARIRTEHAVVVDPGLLVSLGAQVGDSVSLGYATFQIVGTLRQVPGDGGFQSIVGPRIFVSDQWLDETRLLSFGSRASYETLLKMPAGMEATAWATKSKPALEKVKLRVRTAAQSEANVTEAIDTLSSFLGLVGLVALLLGGIGVASGVHAFIRRKQETIAVLRCLGATSGQVLAIYGMQAGMMGLAGAAVGAVLGIMIQLALPALISEMLPVDVSVSLSPIAIASGLGVGVWVALSFALRPLVGVRNISPLQVLRTDVDSSAKKPWYKDWLGLLVTFGIVAGVVALAIARAGDLLPGLAISAGIALVLALLLGSASLLMWVARRALRAGWPYVLRQGVANLYRPSNQTRSVVLSLGFGAFLVSTLYLLQTTLLTRFSVDAAASGGNVLFYDVQDDQGPWMDTVITQSGHKLVQRVPIVTMRLAEVKGVSVKTAQAAAEKLKKAPWPYTREYRSTYRDTLVKSETMTAGKWFDEAPPAPAGMSRVSLDVSIAEDLMVNVGDVLTWNVQGAMVKTVVSSTRKVNFARFEPNFFVVFEPSALRDAPKQFAVIANVTGETAVAALQRDVVRKYPNVSSLDISLITRTITNILDKVSTAIRFMAVFALVMGVPVLVSAVAATRRERLREGVLLKVLGATRPQIARIMVSEYAVLGLLGALAGMLLGIGGAWALARFRFEVPFVMTWGPAFAIAGLLLGITILVGVLTGREVFRETPMAALREG